MTDLQSLDLLQSDGVLVPSKLLKELLFITILLVIQQIHQPKELPHVVLHRSTCNNIGSTVVDCANLAVCTKMYMRHPAQGQPALKPAASKCQAGGPIPTTCCVMYQTQSCSAFADGAVVICKTVQQSRAAALACLCMICGYVSGSTP